jgi:DNA-directed RNA polymerase specialized sigma24 family protein
MKYEETLKEIKSYNLVKSRKKLLEDRLEVFNMKAPVVTNDIKPWRKDSIYTIDINTLLDDLDKCDKFVTELDAAMATLDEGLMKVLELRVIIGLGWIDISEELGLCVRSCRRVLDSAVEHLDTELKKIRGGYGA